MTKRRVQRYASVALFFASTLVGPALLNAVSSADNEWTVLVATIVVSIVLTLVGVWLLESWKWQRGQRTLLAATQASHYPALVLTVGPHHFEAGGRVVASLGQTQLSQVRPRYLALVGSPETVGLMTQVDECLDTLMTRGVMTERPATRVFITQDAQDLLQTATTEAIAWCLAEPDIERQHIVVDVTGGTTSMSLSAFVSATEHGVDCQVVRQDDSSQITILKPTQG